MNAVAPAEVCQRRVTVLRHEPVARNTRLIRLGEPAIARAIRPGQFLMIRPGTGSDPLLARPFAVYDVDRDEQGRPCAIDVVYLIIGRGTQALAAARPGDQLTVWGPLGNGFDVPPRGPVLFVAGGIGQTPFLALARWWLGQAVYAGVSLGPERRATSCRLIYGVRSADLLAGVADFERAGVPVDLATEDGSAGYHGYVTGPLRERLERGERPALMVACGPPPMLGAVRRLAIEFDIACQLSLENHMACGFGACFSCVAPIRQADGSVDLKRVCVEGPVFDARRVVLD